ncbi:MAG: hypothetical protein JWP29_5318 [Rhodoferax sp.]|nr:hypothetical protein [Rhodoferax sp.]
MKILVTGATGFAGGEVLRQLLDDPAVTQVTQVTVLLRRPGSVRHPKLTEVVLNNFLDYTRVAAQLNADACIWCLGVSQTAVSEAEYVEITHGYTVAAARAMLAANQDMRFCFLSGRAADQQERSSTLYGRIKGRTERDLGLLSANVFNFRPAFIRRAHAGQKRPLVPLLFEPVAWVVNHFTDDFSVSVATLAECLIDVAKHGAVQKIFTNRAILHHAPAARPGPLQHR